MSSPAPPPTRAIRFLQEQYGPGRPESLVRRIASELREASQSKGLFREPPVPIELLGEERSIAISRRPAMPCSGRLIPVRGGFRLQLAAEDPPRRQRFTVAHEIAHTFFSPNLRSNLDAGAVPVLLGYDGDEQVERLCDVAASELLIPSADLSARVEALNPSYDIVCELTKVYQVSLTSLARALPGASPRWAIVVCRFGSRPGSTTERLRVHWSSTPSGVFVPRHDSFKQESAVYRSYRSGRRWHGIDHLDLGSLRGDYTLDCIPLGKNTHLVIIDTGHSSKGSAATHPRH